MSLRPLIAANWKMHGDMSWCDKPRSFSNAFPSQERKRVDVLICPPNLLISPMAEAAKAAGVFLGGQTCHSSEQGAHTGETSAKMLRSVGASYVILGHSERRAMGETDEDVNIRVQRS